MVIDATEPDGDALTDPGPVLAPGDVGDQR